MRLATVSGRLVLLPANGTGAIDVEHATGGRFGPDTMAALERWDELVDALQGIEAPAEPIEPGQLQAPVPMPRQLFAIGLNYADHAAESKMPLPPAPLVFTKFPTCLTGPYATVELPSDNVDYEVELVVVIGRRADRVSEDQAWEHVAGVTIGQDLSERVVQLTGTPPQFSLAKSYAGFGPTGPALVTLDEIPDPGALGIGCRVGEEVLQDGNTKDMIFGIPELIARLSHVCPLLPGDQIWTGTPDGVGMVRTPKRYLAPGETLTTWIDGIGELRTSFVAASDHKTRD
ncbi:2-keto-4-pentenoate hydratase/2-oxohepta-3-ene-1,7-dioic acid hydratase (catechol pathway) [Prauserella aidingensis]|uniref:fumarylacetoacetate hydrolase family protein n=1 Tax=Prauserella aidingensis TaxID=387890 RepID=UPI0020A37DFB|nr:fumarylacetoacetate hydrolase family protein [Prauserella aidingensis]MCP2256003.1 2-keto-4-pentenoate hydratase/2-oxohepta-3-ene-1,7-dioic acid hydratase (catechol pathway) [Prauserella aidingensis]